MAIEQGDVYWADLGYPSGSAPGYLHPIVVVQNNVFNRSGINTVIVCVLTSNLRRARVRGNVLLDVEEADLPRQSLVNVTQLFTLDKRDLGEKIGTLAMRRVREILRGIHQVLDPLDEGRNGLSRP